ncbi:MAG TPA: fibronectin type III domain-containing protein, partial [Saprospiraceae bacterium]|nr:fibronectin type III domain-containing protein [Saprospiraceae bacterium]
MKRLLLLLVILFCVLSINKVSSQSTANYAFTYSSTGSLEDISSGSTSLLTGNQDDAASSVVDIGFTFYFMGVPYNQFSVNSNGQMRLGTTVIGNTGITSYSASTPIIAPMSGDNEVNNGVRYKVLGTAPNRRLVVEWNQFYVYYTNISNAGNMQAILYEDSGKIEYIYGEIYNSSSSSVTRSIYISASNTANKSGSVTVAATPTYESSATSPTSNTFAATVLIANLGSTAQGSRKVFTFTPPSPAPGAPVNLSFAAISGSGMTVNWEDNSTNELFFNVFRATDAGFTQNLVITSIASTTTAGTGTGYYTIVSGLQPATTYYYKITASNEGTGSSGLTGSQATNPPGTITAIASGNWSAGSTWDTGSQPTSIDNAVIPSGFTVTVDASTNTCYNLTIDNGGTLNVASGTSYKVTVNNNLTNNGTFDLYTSGTVYATVSFAGAYNSTFSGTGATTDIGVLEINKGSGTVTTSSPVLEVMPSNLTIKGSSNTNTTTGACLTLTNGIVKFSGTYTITNAIFQTAGYSVGSTGGVWLNNPNFTVAGLNGSPTMSGLLRITSGTFNVGQVAGNSMGGATTSKFIFEGGTSNFASRLNVTSSGASFNMSGGTININTVGNSSTTTPSFGFTSTTSVFTMSGGTINMVQPSTGSTPYDYNVACSAPSITGGVLNIGIGSTATNFNFRISGAVPNLNIDNTTNNKTATLYGSVIAYGNTTINTGATMNLNGYSFSEYGSTFTNNGTLTGTTTSSRLVFFSAGAQEFAGSGTVTSALDGLSAQSYGGLTISHTNSFNTYRVNLFGGTIINSNKISLGAGASAAITVQVGATGLTTQGGFFDGAPTFNLGTGTYSILYYPESVARTTGYEIPSSRAVTNITINNTNGVTLNGGDLTLGTASVLGTLTLTSGIFNANGNSVILANTGTTISGGSATSYVNGKLVRSFAASRTATGTYTVATFFPIGKGGTYLPLYIDPTTNSGGTVSFSGEAFNTNSGSMGAGVTSLSANRWEALVTSGSSNLTSTFLRIGDSGIISSNQILQASTAAGSYGSIPSTSTYAAGTPNTLTTTGSQIPAAGYYGYLAYGDLTTCSAPTAQPTNFVTSNNTATSFTGSWTAASPAPSHYLVVRYASGGTPANPVDFSNYTSGNTLGTGIVRYSGTATTFNETGLSAGTTYDYYVYSYNNSGCYGPVYLVTSPLYAVVTTCATVGTPGTPVASNVTHNGFTATWSASSTSGVDYIIDVATDAAFTSFVSGYPKNVGTSLTESVSGLSASTNYYVRVKAYLNPCYSANTSTLTVLTECTPEAAPTTVQDFATYTGAAPPPTCWKEATGTLAASSTLVYGTSEWVSSTGFANTGSNKGVKVNLYSSGNDWIISQPIDLGATPGLYRLKFNMAVTSYNGTASQSTLGTHKVDIVVSTDGGLTWSNTNIIKTYTGVGTYSNTGQEEIVDLATFSNVVKIAFVETTTSSSPDIDFHIDDFVVEAVPPCVEPTGLVASNVTPTSATISWNAAALNFNGYDYEVRTSGAPGSGATGLVASGSTPVGDVSEDINSLTSNTTYYFYVRSKCKTTTSDWAGPGTFFTGYCSPAPSSVDGSGITNVTFSSVNNTTGTETNNYGDYSAMVGDVQRTATVAVAITYQTGYTYDTKIWIDYNDDLDFADAGEEVYTGTSTSANPTTLNASFVVPADAPLGNHRMRIGGVDVGPPTTCYTGTYGTFEDYTVNVIAAPTCLAPTALTATAITSNSAKIGWTAGGSETAWEYVYGLSPLATPSGAGTATTNNPTSLTMLTAASTYQFYVRANCGGGDFSSWAGPYSFTTLCDNLTTFTENFDAVTTPAFPNCWGKVGTSGGAYTQTTTPNSSPNTVYLYGSTGSLGVIKMQPVSNLGAGTHRFRFNMRANFTVGGIVEIGYLTDPNDANTFVSLGTVTANSLTYTEYIFMPAAGSYSNNPAFRHSGTPAYSVLIDDVTWEAAPTDVVDWANLQWPGSGNIYTTSSYVSYGQVWESGVTEGAGQGAGISAWVGYSSTDTDPSTWSAGNWIAATYNSAVTGNNDEYIGTFPANTFTAGTYYYAFRYQLNGGPYRYGAYSAGGGGFWDGTSYVNGQLTVNNCPTITTTATPAVVCYNESSTIGATSSNSNYTYAWNPGGLTGASHVVTPLATTQYNVTATDAGTGCSVTGNVTVNVNPLPSVSITPAGPINIACGDIQQLNGVLSPLASEYTFTPSSGTFNALSGGTTVAISDDDLHSGVIPIGFTFKFENTDYTNVYANSNGFISFNSSSGSATAAQWRSNSSAAPAAMLPLLAPLWDDLDGFESGGVASYKTEGTAPNRIFTMEWLNWEWYWSADVAVISFQVKLYETTNKIEFVYRQEAGAVVSGSASIGVMTSGTNYLMLDGTGTSPNALNSTFTTTLSTKPATGQVYAFERPAASDYEWDGPSGTIFTDAMATAAYTGQNIATVYVKPIVGGTNSYSVDITNGNGCVNTANRDIEVGSCDVTLNLTAYIEGYMDGGSMRPVLQNSGETGTGTQCDNLTVELRNAT